MLLHAPHSDMAVHGPNERLMPRPPYKILQQAAERDGDIAALPRRRFSIRVVQKAWPQPKRLKIGFICGSPACHQLKNNVLVHVSRTL